MRQQTHTKRHEQEGRSQKKTYPRQETSAEKNKSNAAVGRIAKEFYSLYEKRKKERERQKKRRRKKKTGKAAVNKLAKRFEGLYEAYVQESGE